MTNETIDLTPPQAFHWPIEDDSGTILALPKNTDLLQQLGLAWSMSNEVRLLAELAISSVDADLKREALNTIGIKMGHLEKLIFNAGETAFKGVSA